MKYNSYIELKYDNTGYEIFAVKNNKRKRLNKKNKRVMLKVLEKFKGKKIRNDTLIYSNYGLITFSYLIENFKTTTPKVNRTRSKRIIFSVVLTASLIVGIGIHNKRAHAGDAPVITEATQYEEIPDEEIPKINDVESFVDTTEGVLDEDDYVSSLDETIAPEEDDFFHEVEATIDEPAIQLSNNMSVETTASTEDVETTNSATVISYEESQQQEEEFDVNDFRYEYETPNDKGALDNSTQYMDIYKKYERIYGVDANLLCAIGAQESSGIHHEASINGGYATGLMGIEYVWDGEYIEVFNFEDNRYETLKVDYSRIGELDYNIKIGAAIFQSYFYGSLESNDVINNDEMLAYSIQKYNMGPGNMYYILQLGDNWMGNREAINAGDDRYFEHVLSRLDNGTTINVRLSDGTYYKTKITNLSLEYNRSRT